MLRAAADSGLELRATGGVAVALICPSARHGVLAREYADIDFIAPASDRGRVEELFSALGYAPAEEFNALHGASRMFFRDERHQRDADVFIDGVRGCHYLDARDRFTAWEKTLSPADLLLSKLQVVETNEKDYKDAVALLVDHELTDDESGICLGRISELCARDWGWWRTVTMVAERTAGVAREWSEEAPDLRQVPERVRILLDALESTPKSRKWKLRARIGDRVQWHDEPEELVHG